MDLSYIAGFFDGEGNLHCKPPSTLLNITNTDLEVLRQINRFLGAGAIRIKYEASAHRKTAYNYSITNWKDVERILTQLLPYLVVKRAKAEEVLAIIRKTPWQRSNWMPAELRLVQEKYETSDLYDLGREMHKSISAIHAMAHRLGLHRKRNARHNPREFGVSNWRDAWKQIR